MTKPRPIVSGQKGRINLGWSVYQACVHRAKSPKEQRWFLGHSPGMAASLAGVSRQAIHNAVDRKQLTALYVHHDRTGELQAIVIPDDCLQDYIARDSYQRKQRA